jgi:membrane protein implicated in regulation of membrane protease activity
MTWWLWAAGGLAMAVVELLTPGSIFWVFFAAGGLAAAIAVAIWPDLPLVAQAALFVAFSVGSLALFRDPLLKYLQRRMPGHDAAVDTLVGEVALTLDEIPAHGFGKAELRGTAWNVSNPADAPIPRAARCRVEKVDGLTLTLRRE